MMNSGVMTPFTLLIPAVIGSVEPDSPAKQADLNLNDKIVSVNGEEIVKWQDFIKIIKENSFSEIDLEIDRDGYLLNKIVKLSENNKIGVGVLKPEISTTKLNFTFLESVSRGYDRAYWTLTDYVEQFKYVFTKKGASQLGGFAAIGSIFPASWNWQGFWETTALLSIILAFMNVLPIPALDGGHVMFLIYEVVSGRKPNDKVMEYAQITGFMLLMALVLYANGNDVYKFLFN